MRHESLSLLKLQIAIAMLFPRGQIAMNFRRKSMIFTQNSQNQIIISSDGIRTFESQPFFV